MRPLAVFAAGASALWLNACCPAVAPLRPVVEMPRLGELPSISKQELQCLSPEAYDKLVVRELSIKGTLAECQAILETMTEN
jgi:hypothetical protein